MERCEPTMDRNVKNEIEKQEEDDDDIGEEEDDDEGNE